MHDMVVVHVFDCIQYLIYHLGGDYLTLNFNLYFLKFPTFLTMLVLE